MKTQKTPTSCMHSDRLYRASYTQEMQKRHTQRKEKTARFLQTGNERKRYSSFSFFFALTLFVYFSLPMAAQSAHDLPYSCPFSTEEDLSEWTTVNQDSDELTWQMGKSDYGGPGIESKASANFGETSNWLISPALTFQAGGRYQVSFTTYTAYYYDEYIKVTIGSSTDPASHTQLIQEVQIPKYTGYYGYKFTAILPDIPTGDYHIGIQYYTVSSQSMSVCLNNFHVAAVSDGNLTGKITGKDGIPLSDAIVTITGAVSQTTTTDGQGAYSFEKIPQGEYTLVAKKFGFQNTQPYTVTIEPEKTATQDITIYEMEKGELKGKITDGKGNPIAGASIRLEGYDCYQGVSNATGDYSIKGILIDGYSGQYEMTVLKNHYITEKTTAYIYSYGDNIKDMKLTCNTIAPYEVIATANDKEAAIISWTKPIDMAEFKYDNNEMKTTLGFDNSHADSNILGVIYRESMTLYGVSWYLGEETVATRININVLGLDENGNPTAQVIHIAENVPFTKGDWNSFTFDQPIICKNGVMIALSSEGHIGLGIDTNEEIIGKKTQLYSNTMNSVESYTYFEDVSKKGALMLRAKGERLEQNAKEPVLSYNVYRFSDKDKDNESVWNKIATGIQANEYTDLDYAKLASATYHYAISAINADEKESDKTISNAVHCNQLVNVKFSITTNSGNTNDINGALIMLSDSIGHNYQTTVKADGQASFTQIWKGIYNIKVEHPGFTLEPMELDLTNDGPHKYELILKQVLAPVTNIDCTLQEDGMSSLLQWDVYPDIFDDFEGKEYTDFEINPAGRFGWQYVDKDMRVPYVFSGSTFPGMGEKSAAVLMNGTAVEPQVTTNIAHSGKRELAFFACASVVNEEQTTKFISDDYLISPELNFHKDFKLSFYARTYQMQNGVYERLRVGYSEKTADIEDFLWITDGYIELPEAYTLYEFHIPQEAKYIAINNSSRDCFIMLLDDICLSTGIIHSDSEPSFGEFTGYKVLVDSKEIASVDTKTTQYMLDWKKLGTGTHTVSVIKCYNSGNSEPLEVTVAVAPSGISTIGTNDINIKLLHNNMLSITGINQGIYVYNMSAQVVAAAPANTKQLDLSNLQRGVYLVKVIQTNGLPITHKIVIK